MISATIIVLARAFTDRCHRAGLVVHWALPLPIQIIGIVSGTVRTANAMICHASMNTFDSSFILEEFAQKMQEKPDLDTVCIAGNGEPSDHPDFVSLVSEIAEICVAERTPLVLLTNGDGLVRQESHRAALSQFDMTFIKWDPGPPAGSWRQLSPEEREERHSVIKELDGIAIQSLAYTCSHKMRSHNSTPAAWDRWLASMTSLEPQAIHLTTISRDSRPPSKVFQARYWRHARHAGPACHWAYQYSLLLSTQNRLIFFYY